MSQGALRKYNLTGSFFGLIFFAEAHFGGPDSVFLSRRISQPIVVFGVRLGSRRNIFKKGGKPTYLTEFADLPTRLLTRKRGQGTVSLMLLKIL